MKNILCGSFFFFLTSLVLAPVSARECLADSTSASRIDCDKDSDCVDEVQHTPGCAHYFSEEDKKHNKQVPKLCRAFRKSDDISLLQISCTVSWPCVEPSSIICVKGQCASQ